MRRPSSLPIVVQVAALTAAAVIATLAVAFAVVLLAPPPAPPGMTVQAAAEALAGRPARSSDGRRLTRRVVQTPPPVPAADSGLSRLVETLLSERMGLPRDQVRAVVLNDDRHPPLRVDDARVRTREMFVVRAPGASDPARGWPPGWTPRPDAPGDARATFSMNGRVSTVFTQRLTGDQGGLLAGRISFTPQLVAARLPDGRWAVVEPPRGLLSPWQARVLLALGASLALLAPLVWWMARRLTRPIRLFAEAAERLGADPEAAPLPPSGPAEVRTAIEAFNDMQASLRGHMRQRTQTVAAIAHDLRTPLTRLRFRAEQAPAGVRDRMAADIEEMDALIGQAMAYVRGEAPSHRRDRFDMAALAAEVARGFAETGASVTVALPDPLWVEADPAALRRALSNLIGNAVKYAGAAEVSGRIDDDGAVIEIADRGPGVADEGLELLFEPFRRGEASRNRDTGGAGLGLTVARQAARASGGDVTLANRSGGGLIAALRLLSAD